MLPSSNQNLNTSEKDECCVKLFIAKVVYWDG